MKAHLMIVITLSSMLCSCSKEPLEVVYLYKSPSFDGKIATFESSISGGALSNCRVVAGLHEKEHGVPLFCSFIEMD